MASRRTTSDAIPRPLKLVMATVAAAVLVVLVSGHGTALAKKRSYRLKKGVTLTTVAKSKGPIHYRYITVSDPSQREATVDVGSASRTFPGTRRPSEIGSSYGAIAAINGDFGRSGRPLHPSAEDGELRTSGLRTGVALGVSHGERRGWAERPAPRIVADTSDGQAGRFVVDVWNAGSTGRRRLAAYTPVGGSIEKPGTDTCSAKLTPESGDAGKRRLGPDGDIVRTYVVERQPDPCPHEAASVGDAKGTVVLAARRETRNGNTLRALEPGDRVKLSWTIGWPSVVDVLGGAPQLLVDPDDDGHPTNKAPKECGSYFCNRNPRSAVGVNRACATGSDGCKVILMTVDGRQSNWSIGMDLVQLSRAMREAGADWAINLDGGGGAAMWVDKRGRYCQRRAAGGCLVSRPSDPSGERPAISSVMVLPGPDRGERLAASGARAAAAAGPERGTAADLAAADAAMSDPGSTGGLLDALFGGGLGRVPSRSSPLAEAVGASRR